VLYLEEPIKDIADVFTQIVLTALAELQGVVQATDVILNLLLKDHRPLFTCTFLAPCYCDTRKVF